MCMCLKDHLDANECIQHTSHLENTLDFKEAIYDEEVQAGEAISLFDEEIAQDEAACEARSGYAWMAYMNARIAGLFLLVLLEYLNGFRSSVRMTMHEVVHEMVVGECHEPNFEGSGSAWMAYMNPRIVGLFMLVLLEYPNGRGIVGGVFFGVVSVCVSVSVMADLFLPVVEIAWLGGLDAWIGLVSEVV
uniref:Zinc finger BED domain-containing protein RICESLEEPER 2 n=1 Tax=Tanacetum cinerariifolium TaxID=118510 RepID=A0A699H6U2_TANCI|nr:zinc finger BED domain-containing protein RICESLEEPER 2 [Tanacetum cinerariifolium]